MKITDSSQPVLADNSTQTCTIVFFASEFKDLPISQRIGDIIRVHRATVSEYNGVKQLVSKLYYNSSWALFSPLTTKTIKSKDLGFVIDQ